LLATASFANDVSKKNTPPQKASVAPFSWTGFYGGVNLGYNWSNSSAKSAGLPVTILPDPDFDIVTPQRDILPLPNQGSARQGFIGGIQLGYNYQINQFVLGAEADFMGTNTSKSKSSSFTLIDPPDPASGDLGGQVTVGQINSVRQNWLGTVRARAGFAADRALIYATGGFAYGNARVSSRVPVTSVDFSPEQDEQVPVNVTWAGAKTATRLGYTLGAGLEYAVTDNWILRAEYLYYNLGDVNVVSQPSPTLVNGNVLNPSSTKVRIDGNMARLALSYKF
jgi:outer membrane immunogenic protein